MFISNKFGPQFDPTDGTIGKLQLVKRFAIVNKDGMVWPARQGRCTHKDFGGAQAHLDLVRKYNLTRLDTAGFKVIPMWCYPEHFDPVGSAEQATKQEE